MNSVFMPVSRADMDERGIDRLDFILVTGDAYVDHPSFGTAIISRVLESQGHTVGIISQPDWKNLDSFRALGEPKYGFLVNSGNIDSMVAHYSVAKNRREQDAYSPGGKAGLRPDRAVIVYCNKIREAFGSVPIVIGGLEASLRRFAHYDYWQNEVRRSILVDSSADILSFGMGERSMKEICRRLADGEDVKTITDIAGTCVITDNIPENAVFCPSFEEVKKDKKKFAEATLIQYNEQDAFVGRPLVQKHSLRYVLQNVPSKPLTQAEMDEVYALPYTRTYHPMYEKDGGVPGLKEVEFSITHNRGCFGGCNFCSIVFHQGRNITARSKESVVKEAKLLTTLKNYKGYIHDIGGPTANFRKNACAKKSLCKDKKCLAPEPCAAAKADHSEYLDILREVRSLPNVKKVFIRSGIRFDYLMLDKKDDFFNELVKYHISGQLKVAPEHSSDRVLEKMGKPHFAHYRSFYKKYFALNKKFGCNQFLVPYLMSSHPGCTLNDAVNLALYIKSIGYQPEQVQDFYPTPGTVSTAMFYTGLDPFTMEPVYVPRTAKEKAYQRALLQYKNPKNRALVKEALLKCGRGDLIGVLR